MANMQRTMHWLTIDMKKSTKKTSQLSTNQLKEFDLAFIDQIGPHLQELKLAGDLLKFTGDGWLLAVTDEKVHNLCCLAIIMAQKFQEEMATRLDKIIEEIPPLRLAICAGYDTLVELPNGNIDWVGDGARYSVRASGRSYHDNEIIIDHSTLNVISRDFESEAFDENDRPPSEKEEEEPPIKYILKDLKPNAASDSSAPEYYSYTLSVLAGKKKPATGKVRKYESVHEDINVHDNLAKIDIFVDPKGEGISGGQLDFAFDPGVIHVDDVNMGSVFGANPNAIGPNIDNKNGTVSLALSRKGMTTPPTSAGTFVSLEVRVPEDALNGEYPFEVKNVSFSDSDFGVIDPDKVKVSLKSVYG